VKPPAGRAFRGRSPLPRSGVEHDEDIASQPALLGALFDAVVASLEGLPRVTLTGAPGMADFAAWVLAAEPALGWPAGDFLRVYARNRGDANGIAIEASPIGPLLVALATEAAATEAGEWVGVAGELLAELTRRAEDVVKRNPDWPRMPRALSGELRRLAPALRGQGVVVIFPDKKREAHTRRRLYRLSLSPAQPSPSSPPPPKAEEIGDLGNAISDFDPAADGIGDGTGGDGRASSLAQPSPGKPAETFAGDDGDDGDGHAGQKEDDLWR
jgi:hypothetical protein